MSKTETTKPTFLLYFLPFGFVFLFFDVAATYGLASAYFLLVGGLIGFVFGMVFTVNEVEKCPKKQ